MERGCAIYCEEQGDVLKDLQDLQDKIEEEENKPEKDAEKLNNLRMKILMRGLMMQQFPFVGQFHR